MSPETLQPEARHAAINRRRFIRGAGYGGAIALTLLFVLFATTRKGASARPEPAAKNAALAAVPTPAGGVTLSAADARRIGVTFAPVTVGALGKEVRVVGQITYDETSVSAVAPKLDGYVERLLVNATGQWVSAGQPLLTIYSPMLVTAEEELLLARRLGGDVSGASSDTRQNAADLISSARRRLLYWDISPAEIAEIERTGVVRKTLTLRSPSSGYVLEKNVLPGQRIMPGGALYKLADLRTVWLEGEVFEQDLAAVRIGQLVRAELQALPGQTRTGRIAYIYPTLNPETRTVRIRVVLPNSDLRLKPGMYATLRITGTEQPFVLTVPRSAVLSTGERSIVFVRAQNGALIPREVTVGSSSDERIEILRGVSAGETVVSSATFLLDAESNLGTALGGMGNMPGMEVTTPPKPLPPRKE